MISIYSQHVAHCISDLYFYPIITSSDLFCDCVALEDELCFQLTLLAQATYMAARTQKRLLFRSLAPIKVKGKSELIWVYR